MSRPSVISAAFDFQTLPQKITTQFDQNVSTSLTAADLRVDRVSASDSGPITTSLTYNPTTNMATNAFAGVLPDGNFRAVLSSEGVTSTGGEFLTADKVLDFFFLSGDVNHDRWVNSDDFNIVSTNFGQTGRTFGQGDANYDGKVDSDDFNVLGTKFGASMAAPPTAPDIVAVSPLSTTEINLQWVDHTDGELGMRVQRSEHAGQTFDWYINLPANTTTWTDTSLQDGKDYTYRVRAYGNGLDTAYTPKVRKFTVLASPAAITAFAISGTEMQVEWADLSQSETGYEIRALRDGASPVVIGGIAANVTSRVVTGLQAGVEYTFEVRALGGADGSAWIPTAVATQTWGTSLEFYFEDFEGGVGNEWSPNDKNDTHPMRPNDEVLGMFDNRTATLNLSGLPQHTSVKLEYTAIAHIENSGTGVPDSKAAMWTVTGSDQQVEHYRMDGSGLSTVWSLFGATHTIGHTGTSFSASFAVEDMEPEKGETWGLTTVRVSLERPAVSISAPLDFSIENSGTNPYFRIARSGDTAAALQVQYRVLNDSSADPETDYAALSGTATIAAGSDYVDVPVDPVDNQTPEWTEDVRVELVPQPRCYVSNAGPASIEIVDNDLGISSPPGEIRVNNDDDDEDGEPDKFQSGPVAGEDDLYVLSVDVPKDVKYGATVTLARTSGNIRVWENSDRSGTLFIDEARSAYTWTMGQATVPTEVYIEAHDGSGAIGDMALSLLATDSSATVPATHPTTTQAATTPTTARGVELVFRDEKPGAEVQAGNVIVGERIEIEARPLGPGDNSTFVWDVPEIRIADFFASPDGSQVIPLTRLAEDDVAFHWIDGADNRKVTVSGSHAGHEFAGVISFDVKRPTAQINIAKQNVSVDNNFGAGGTTYLHVGKGNIEAPATAGVFFSAATPGFAGDFQWAQLTNSTRRYFRVGENRWHRSVAIGLDSLGGYPTTVGSKFADSPGMALDAATITKAEVDETFGTWLMYKPTREDSIFVPLARLDWRWAGKATHGGQNWALDAGSGVDPDPQKHDTTEFPIWDERAEFDYQPE